MWAIKIIPLALALMGAETLHGILRTVLVAPRLGGARAKRWSVLSGSLIAYGIGALLVPWLGIADAPRLLLAGAALAALMSAFDIALGRWVMRLPWGKVLGEFDPRGGNLLAVGIALLVVMPYAVMRW